MQQKYKVILLLLIFILPFQLFGIKKVGQAGFKFLDIDYGARASGMGEAYAVNSKGVNSVFYNPAGLVKMDQKFSANVNYTKWIAGITYQSGALAMNLGNLGTLAGFFIVPSYPELQGTIYAENEDGYLETGNFSVSAGCFGLSYAKQLTDQFSIGGNVKWAYQDLGDGGSISDSGYTHVTSTLGYDIGTLFQPKFKNFESFAIGMFVRNFSSRIKFQHYKFELPLTFQFGVSCDLFDLLGEEREDIKLTYAIDAINPRDYTQRIHTGIEMMYNNLLAVRGGYKFNYDDEGLTLGLGIHQKFINFDYAFNAFDTFKNVHRVSVSFDF